MHDSKLNGKKATATEDYLPGAVGGPACGCGLGWDQKDVKVNSAKMLCGPMNRRSIRAQFEGGKAARESKARSQQPARRQHFAGSLQLPLISSRQVVFSCS
jgi:hypothetical protein